LRVCYNLTITKVSLISFRLLSFGIFCLSDDSIPIGMLLANVRLLVSLDTGHRNLRRLVLVAVPVVDRISESGAVFGHFGVATQYMLLILWTCTGPAGPCGAELPSGWLVLICEEGLVPPINTNSSDKRFGQIIGNKRRTKGV
jgi:hypothetical protein